MDKQALVDQLVEQLRASARAAMAVSAGARQEAQDGATPAEKREDARAAHQQSSLGTASTQRARAALSSVDALATFRPVPLAGNARVELGAIVEIEDEDTSEGRTVFLAPVGAGTTLTGPGGDGFLSVVTPVSPLGRSILGKRVGDVAELTAEGDVRTWKITFVG